MIPIKKRVRNPQMAELENYEKWNGYSYAADATFVLVELGSEDAENAGNESNSSKEGDNDGNNLGEGLLTTTRIAISGTAWLVEDLTVVSNGPCYNDADTAELNSQTCPLTATKIESTSTIFAISFFLM